MELAQEMLNTLSATVERLACAVEILEASAVGRVHAAGEVAKLTAAIEEPDASERELELTRRLATAEQEIARLQAGQSGELNKGTDAIRKTLPPATVHLLAKSGLNDFGAMEVSSIDAALIGLNIEQRMAVKAQLIRAGALLS